MIIKKESIFSKLEYQVVDFKNDRFAIANMDGRIIDDAQGYGYKTKQSAHKAAYFIQNKSKITGENGVVVGFMRKHKDFQSECEQTVWEAFKGNEQFGITALNNIATRLNLKLPMGSERFYKVMTRKSCKWSTI